MRRFSLLLLVAVCVPAMVASPAAASVTIGQLAPGSPPSVSCGTSPVDLLQPAVAAGNSYAVPATVPNGVVTSWSHNAAASLGQELKMKIFRKIGEPATYQVVGHDGLRPLDPGTVNSFPARIQVKAGDLLGLNDGNASTVFNACTFTGGAGDSHAQLALDLGDGESGAFGIYPNIRANVTAVVEADADNDGFGDETQDQCPTNATTQGPCPATATGQRAAAIKTCKKKFPGKAKAKKRKKCIKKAKKLSF